MAGLQKVNMEKIKAAYTSYLDKSEKDSLYRFDAHVNKENIGYLTCRKSKDAKYIWIKGLKIKTKYRKLGIATELIKKALKKYKNKEIRLRARPYGKNKIKAKELINFYKKFGFKVYDKENRMFLKN